MNEVNDRLSYTRSDNPRVLAEKTLIGLGFKYEELERPTETFSQGWNMRIELAKILLSKPDVLLLDEPTNHLDIESIEWLEGYLKDYRGSLVLISHMASLSLPSGKRINDCEGIGAGSMFLPNGLLI